jgi:cell division protease FtsH
VLALAHALESHKTLTGDDVIAVLEGKQGPLVDGRPYQDPALTARLEEYHEFAVEAHQSHAPLTAPLPRVAGPGEEVVVGEVLSEPAPEPGAPHPVEKPEDRPAADEPAATNHHPPTE